MDGDHAGNVRDPSRVLEQGPDRQRAPDWCSGGVSSIRGASESRCHHDGPADWGRQWLQPIRHRSLPAAMALHEGGFTARAAHQHRGRLAQPELVREATSAQMGTIAEPAMLASPPAAELVHAGWQLQRLGARAGGLCALQAWTVSSVDWLSSRVEGAFQPAELPPAMVLPREHRRAQQHSRCK